MNFDLPSSWWFIIVAALISLGFRSFPLLFKSKSHLLENGRLAAFLNYAACAIIGCIIYLTAFNNASLSELYQQGNWSLLVKIVVLLTSFFINLKLKKPIITFLLCVVLYGALSYFFGV